MAKALFAGTFELFHLGHIDVLKQASQIFEHVYVAVSYNPKKSSTDINIRYQKVCTIIAELQLNNVSVVINNGFGVVCADAYGCEYLVRGIRDLDDANAELQLGYNNQRLFPDIRTIFIQAKVDLKEYSSTNLLKQANSDYHE